MYQRLKGKIIEQYNSMSGFADHLGKPVTYVTRRVNGITKLNTDDVKAWATNLNISAEEIGTYFFEN